MPSVARDRIAETDDYGVVEDRHEDVERTTTCMPQRSGMTPEH